MTQTALILGSTGRFGRQAAEAFWNAGWRVRLFNRGEDLVAAANGVDVIVNGWNPPYPRWQADLPGLTAQVIAAAKASGATVFIPGNVYVYGADAPERFAPDTPHGATNPLGQCRIEMETAYREAGIPVILLRAGDFIDTEPSGNWFDAIMVKPLAKGRLTYPGPGDRAHAWAYLPDVARAAVMLCNARDALPRFADLAFPGFTLTGHDLADAIGRARGHPVRFRAMSWLPIRLIAPFWATGRGLLEMRYLWQKPHHLDGTAFAEVLPEFRSTDPVTALAAATAHIPHDASAAMGVSAAA